MNAHHAVINISPGGSLQGTIQVPGDKSISHRALMLAAIASGETQINGFLEGEDTLATLAAFKLMGVDINRPAPQQVVIDGKGMYGLHAPGAVLDCGNSGTAARLLTGLLAGQKFDSQLCGDESLSKRPMLRVIEPLQQMGADITASESGTLPLRIRGGQKLTGIEFTLPVASAQLKSCLLLAGLYAEGETVIVEPCPTRDHTERMLEVFGCPLERMDYIIKVRNCDHLSATVINIPGDLSSATFFILGSMIAEDSDMLLTNVGINPTRNAVISIFQQMGANILIENERVISGEPVADIHVSSSKLEGIEIPEALVPNAIDEFPAIMIAAACARGETRLHGAEELRLKESDRIAAIATGLQALGICVETYDDGLSVQGGSLTSGVIDSRGDHRIAMAFAMAGLKAQGSITLNDCSSINTSFPGFVELARQAGLKASWQ